MKNQFLRFAKVLMMIPCLVFLVNCSKSSKDNNNANQCTQYNQGYGQQYGQYNQYGNGSTYYNNNCNNGQYPNQGGTQQCVGTYWYQGTAVLCQYAQSCAGYTLQVNSTGPNSPPAQQGATVRCI